MEEIPTPKSSATIRDGDVTQVAYTEPDVDESEAIKEIQQANAAEKGMRAVLREKEAPYLTTDGFTLYEVEVIYE
jgi:hypothetical protein